MHKLDMGKAWSDATALIGANRDVILIVAGVFVFLPNAVLAMFMPQSEELAAMQASGNADPQEVLAQMTAYYGEIWWMFVLLGIVQAVGVLGLLTLLTDRSRPTVGEALGFGAKGLLPYIVAQILLSLGIVALGFALVMAGAAIHVGLAAVLGLVAVTLAIYLWIKFSLLSPVIAIEKQMNPVEALRRSWQLTKGNSLRLFAFYLLLFLVLIVLTLVAGIVFAMFALAGQQVGEIVGALGGSLLNMITVVVMLAVLAAIHRQLSGGAATQAEVFE